MSTQTNGHAQEEEIETEVGTLELLSGGDALSAVDRAAIDVQVATAKRYPRKVSNSLKEALTLATLDEETAGSMIYALPRGGKAIEGPSARLAEVMAYSWGNLRADADIVAEDKTHVTAMGTCFDLEKNVAIRVRVKRRITDSKGKRYNEDMIGVTSNAAISIALRNSVFKVIPRAFVERIYAEARRASLGKGGTMAQKRQMALEWFAKVGVTQEQIFTLLNVAGLDDVGEDQLITLRGLKNAIKEGEASVESIFRPSKHSEGTDELNQAIRGNAAQKQQPAAPEEKDDRKPATKAQLDLLKDLRDRAFQRNDVIGPDDDEEIKKAISDKDGPAVRRWIRELSKMLLDAATGGQAPLI